MLEMQLEVQIMRDEIANLAKVAGMATEEAQRAALRVDNLEYEWLLWSEGHPQDADHTRSHSSRSRREGTSLPAL